MMKSSLLLILFLLMVGCDFTPPIHRKILRAQNYVGKQQYRRAILLYQQIIGESPSPSIAVKIYEQLGELYLFDQGNYAKALSYFEQIVKEGSDPYLLVSAKERIADIHFEYYQNYVESEKHYGELVQFRPKLKKHDFYLFRFSESLLNQKKYSEAQEVLNRITIDPTNRFYVQSFYLLGLSYYFQKKFKKAIVEWKEYLKREKRRDHIVKTKFIMANAYENLELLKIAYNLYYSILGEYPNTKVLQNRLNSVYNRKVSRKR